MKFTVLKENLLPILQQAVRFVSTKPQLPILASFFIETANDELILSATDLQLGIRTRVPATIEDTGACVVPAKLFLDLVNSVQSSTLSCTLSEQTLSVTAGKAKANIQTFLADDYPPFPKKEGDSMVLPTSLVQQSCEYVGFASSKDETRPVLTSMLFEFSDKTRIVATDGYRLAILAHEFSFQPEMKILFQAKSLLEVAKSSEQLQAETVEVAVSDGMKQAFFDLGKTEIVTRVIEGDFPNFEKIFPKEFRVDVTCDKQQLEKELKTAMIFSKESSGIIKLKVGESSLIVESSSTAVGAYQAEIEIVNNSKETCDIAFNGRYVQEFLQKMSAEVLRIKLNEPLKPGLFLFDDFPAYQYLVMPFRLSGE